jgi:hypothetical protein
VSVSIGGSAATVLFAGLAPGLHAVYQINIQPPQTFLGNTLSITAGNYSGKSLTLPVMAGTNVANATATVSALYPTAGTTLGFSALLVAGSFTTAFDVVPGAKAFQVVVLGNGNALATINIDPVGNTWQATYPVPTALARNYNFAGAGVVVYDYLAGMPFPGNIIPLSRLDLAAVSAAGMLPLPNSAAVNGANGTWTASGTLPAGGHFAINSSSLTQLQNFGAFTFLPSNEPGGSYPATFTVYVDNMQVASSTLQFAIQ